MKCLDTCSCFFWFSCLSTGRIWKFKCRKITTATTATVLFYDIMIIRRRKHVEWCGSEPIPWSWGGRSVKCRFCKGEERTRYVLPFVGAFFSFASVFTPCVRVAETGWPSVGHLLKRWRKDTAFRCRDDDYRSHHRGPRSLDVIVPFLSTFLDESFQLQVPDPPPARVVPFADSRWILHQTTPPVIPGGVCPVMVVVLVVVIANYYYYYIIILGNYICRKTITGFNLSFSRPHGHSPPTRMSVCCGGNQKAVSHHSSMCLVATLKASTVTAGAGTLSAHNRVNGHWGPLLSL